MPPPCPRFGNCLTWAVARWLTRGGALWVERSAWGWWWHFAWSPDGREWFCYVPTWPKEWWTQRWWRRWCPPPLFRGVVKEGMR